MARILILTPRYRGHFHPMVGVAQWLRRMDCTVKWLTISGPPAEFSNLGVDISSLPDLPPIASRLGGPDWFIENLRRKAARVPRIREVIRQYTPDVVVMDLIDESIISARLEGVTYAIVSVSAELVAPMDFDCEWIRNQRRFAAERVKFFAGFGMAPELWNYNMLSPWLNTIFTTAALIGEDVKLPPRTLLVGPSIPPGNRGDETEFPWEKLRSDRPLIYTAFGSSSIGPGPLYEMIAHAASDLGVQVVLSAGEWASSAAARALPGDVLVVPYAPQLSLLERASVFVTHGGFNSVADALYQGIPMLVLPMCNDQPYQGYFVEKARVGRTLLPAAVTREGIRKHLVDLLAPDEERAAALQRIKQSFRANDGARTAAAEIVALAGARV